MGRGEGAETMRRVATILMMLIPVSVSAASLPANQQLALKLMKDRGDDAASRDAATVLVQTSAVGFASGAPLRDVPVNAKALKKAVKAETKAAKPRFVDATVQAYVSTFSQDELARLTSYYKKSAKKRGKMDPALNAKFRQVAEQRAANMAPLRSALPGNLFKAYCTRATCNDAVNTAIAAFGNG